MAALEAQIDFSDVEDADDFTLQSVRSAAQIAIARIDRALATADWRAPARRLHRRDRRAPNVGKSTLMNAFAGRDVAIISPIPEQPAI